MQALRNLLPGSALLPALFCLAVAGCGGGDGVQRHNLKGNVTFDGQPVVFGEITFVPDEGPMGSATIRNGLYDTSLPGGKGVVDGNHKVIISGYENELISTGDEVAEEENEVNQPPLFLNYETSANLDGDTMDFAVPAEAANKAPQQNSNASDAP
jgi:hypothetical protein